MSAIDDTELAALRQMADEWTCQKLHLRYLQAFREHDRDLLLSLFTPDARYGPATGITAIREEVDRFWPLFEHIAENNHLVPLFSRFDLDGDTASADIYGIGFVQVSGGDGTNKLMVNGMGYREDFVRTSAGWRISAMRGIVGGFGVIHDTTWRFDTDLTDDRLQ